MDRLPRHASSLVATFSSKPNILMKPLRWLRRYPHRGWGLSKCGRWSKEPAKPPPNLVKLDQRRGQTVALIQLQSLRVAVPIRRSRSGLGRMKKSGTAAKRIRATVVLHPANTTAKAYPSIGAEWT